MGNVIENLNRFGNVGNSAFDAAVDGIAASTNIDTKAVDNGLKLFGNFERSQFEYAAADASGVQAIQNSAEYGKPAEVIKQFEDSAFAQNYMVPFKDVIKNMEDPKFKVSDGLASFTQKEISKTLGGLTGDSEKGMVVIDSRPGGTPDLGQEKGIIIEGDKPGDTNDAEKGMVVVDGRPGRTPDLGQEKGIVIEGGKTGDTNDTEKGIIVVDTKPGDTNDTEKGMIIIDSKPGNVNDLESKGIIIVDNKPADFNAAFMQGLSDQQRTTLFQDSLAKLKKLETTASQQLALLQTLNMPKMILR
ncbi:hypothetical protein L0222_31260 [bacterium]|nr:hypothetical protein [bacterium]